MAEHFLTPHRSEDLFQNLVSVLRKTIPLRPQQSASIISLLTDPSLETFELILDCLERT